MTKRPTELSELASLDGWDALQKEEQTTIQSLTELALQDLETEHKSRLSFGTHLITLNDILRPQGMWKAYLHSTFSMSQASAYRYMDLAKAVQERLPDHLRELAIRRGVDIRPRALKMVPVVKSDDPKKIEAYFEKISRPAPRVIAITDNLDQITKDCVHYTLTRIKRLPKNSRTKANFLRSYVGILISELGIESKQTFEPVEMPEQYRVLRGRPRKKVA